MGFSECPNFKKRETGRNSTKKDFVQSLAIRNSNGLILILLGITTLEAKSRGQPKLLFIECSQASGASNDLEFMLMHYNNLGTFNDIV